jgi:hypothetical protein
VVEALILCSQCQSAVNQIFNLSNDCKLSDIVLSLSLDKKVRHEIMIIPEWFVRLVINLTPSFFKLPLTQSRIDALVSRVYYPNTKIKQTLKFLPKKSIPDFAMSFMIDAYEK